MVNTLVVQFEELEKKSEPAPKEKSSMNMSLALPAVPNVKNFLISKLDVCNYSLW